jgi:hypothetical protein
LSGSSSFEIAVKPSRHLIIVNAFIKKDEENENEVRDNDKINVNDLFASPVQETGEWGKAAKALSTGRLQQ